MSKKNRKKSLDRSADDRTGKNVPLPALKRRWVVYSAAIGLAVLGAVAILNVGGLMGEPAAKAAYAVVEMCEGVGNRRSA